MNEAEFCTVDLYLLRGFGFTGKETFYLSNSLILWNPTDLFYLYYTTKPLPKPSFCCHPAINPFTFFLFPIPVILDRLVPVCHGEHLLDRPELERVSRGVVAVLEWSTCEEVVGAAAVHLVGVLLGVMPEDPVAHECPSEYRRGIRGSIRVRVEVGVVELLARLEAHLLGAGDTFEPLVGGDFRFFILHGIFFPPADSS